MQSDHMIASEPGCGFSQTFVLDLELSVFLAKLRKIFMLGGRQALAAAFGVQIGLFDPLPKRLPRELELRLDNILPEARRVRVGVFSGHGRTFLSQAKSIHGTGPASALNEKLNRACLCLLLLCRAYREIRS